VRAAFRQARARAPCILLIDQLEALARRRDDEASGSGGGTTQRVLACLLTEMDGIDARQ
jgi:AAA family ATPase